MANETLLKCIQKLSGGRELRPARMASTSSIGPRAKSIPEALLFGIKTGDFATLTFVAHGVSMKRRRNRNQRLKFTGVSLNQQSFAVIMPSSPKILNGGSVEPLPPQSAALRDHFGISGRLPRNLALLARLEPVYRET